MYKVILQVIFAGLLLMSMIGCVSVRINPSEGTYLPDPVTARGIDTSNQPLEPTTVFKTTDKRIYATICPRGPDHIHLGARWYRDNELITDQAVDLLDQQCGAWYLESPPGGTFPAGDYRVEIYLVKSANKIAHFKVIK